MTDKFFTVVDFLRLSSGLWITPLAAIIVVIAASWICYKFVTSSRKVVPPLFSYPPLLLAVIGPWGLAFILWALFAQDQIELFRFSWTQDGSEYFWKVFRIPIAISALSIPFGGLVAAHHRSLQHEESRILQAEQNNFANYFKHLEEFERFCEQIRYSESGYDIRNNIDFRVLHSKLYSGLRQGSSQADLKFIQMLKSEFSNATAAYQVAGEALPIEFADMKVLAEVTRFALSNISSALGKSAWDVSPDDSVETMLSASSAICAFLQECPNFAFSHSWFMKILPPISIAELSDEALAEIQRVAPYIIWDGGGWFCKEPSMFPDTQMARARQEFKELFENFPADSGL